ncbi:hypothetical protein MMC25_007266 [Agyrium rufum]|nr:hypothetical protein [Agyrium rufum]
MTEATESPLSGLWKPSRLSQMYYGPSSVQKHMISILPSKTSKAFIVTGSSLATKTPLISQLESLLGPDHHAATFSKIAQHAPVAQIDEAASQCASDSAIDTVISVGGGSPIDAAKIVSHRCHEKNGKHLFHITIPTTISAAECTHIGGYTAEDGTKQSVVDPALTPDVIIYDAEYAVHTPEHLFLSTGIRSLDHAVELMYHPNSVETPTKVLALSAIEGLFTNLQRYKKDPKDLDAITRCQIASFASLYPVGYNVQGGLGLSHSLGYALGSPYSIPHGVTSCLTLAKTVRIKAELDPYSASQIARMLPVVERASSSPASVANTVASVIPGVTAIGRRSGDDLKDAGRVADAIDSLVKELGLETNLEHFGVSAEKEAEKVTKSATKSDSGELYEKVLAAVKKM